MVPYRVYIYILIPFPKESIPILYFSIVYILLIVHRYIIIITKYRSYNINKIVISKFTSNQEMF